MENPGSWTSLVASLAVAELDDADLVWRFLREGQLVRDDPIGPTVLRVAIDTETLRRITGGSLAYRIATHLIGAKLPEPAASRVDPYGKAAKHRWNAFAKTHGLEPHSGEES